MMLPLRPSAAAPGSAACDASRDPPHLAGDDPPRPLAGRAAQDEDLVPREGAVARAGAGVLPRAADRAARGVSLASLALAARRVPARVQLVPHLLPGDRRRWIAPMLGQPPPHLG